MSDTCGNIEKGQLVQCKTAFKIFEISANKNNDLHLKGCCTNVFRTHRDYMDENYVQIDELREYSKTFRLDELTPCKHCSQRDEGYVDLTAGNYLFNNRIFIKIGSACNALCKICRDGVMASRESYELDVDACVNAIKQRVTRKDLNELHEISIYGGETLMYFKEVSRLMENLKANDLIGSTQFCLFTNGSIDPTPFIEMMKQYTDNYYFLVSIDGDYKTNHMMRPNCELEKIEKHIRIIEANGGRYTINHTVSSLNIEHIKNNVELYYNTFPKLWFVSVNIVYNPQRLSVNKVDNKKKIAILKDLKYLDYKYNHNWRFVMDLKELQRELFSKVFN